MKLDESHPELCKEWDYDKNENLPEQFTFGISKKVWWICSKNPHHGWQALISSRARLNSGCPICANKTICKCGCNSLAVKYPDQCTEWHPKNAKTSKEYAPISNIKVWWKCKKDPHHEWEDTISHRTGSMRGCPICSNYKICKCGCNSLATRRPDIAAQWDYDKNTKTPQQVPYSSGLYFWWKCDKCPDHKWRTTVDSRNRDNTKYPFCMNQKICPCGCNSFGKRFPEIAKEWDYEKNNKSPFDYTYQSGIKVWWICSKKPEHKWKTGIYYRTNPKQLTKCPYCRNPSKGEIQILKCLKELDIDATREKRYKECFYKQQLSFDIYISDFNILIEFDGLHHFKKTGYYNRNAVRRDLIKTLYAKGNHYFLRICYREIGKIMDIVTEFVTDVINNDIEYGFHYNYCNNDITEHIQQIYNLQQKCSENNISKIHQEICELIEEPVD